MMIEWWKQSVWTGKNDAKHLVIGNSWFTVGVHGFDFVALFPFSPVSIELKGKKSVLFSHRHRPNAKRMYSVWYIRSMVIWQNEIKLSCKFVTMNLHQKYIRLVVNVYFIRIIVLSISKVACVCVSLNVKGYRNWFRQQCNLIESK